MPSTRHLSYDLNFKLKIVNNNREIAREYGISESMVRKWRKQQDVLFSGKLKMTAKRALMGRYRPKDPELDQTLADWFSEQRSQDKHSRFHFTFVHFISQLPESLIKFKFYSPHQKGSFSNDDGDSNENATKQ